MKLSRVVGSYFEGFGELGLRMLANGSRIFSIEGF